MTHQIHRRQRACRIGGWIGLLLLTLLCIFASLTLGAKPLPLSAVWHYFSADDRNYNDLVIDARLPRTFIGLMAGAALALSGSVTQGLLRNPLGDPGLLGVNAGASAIIVSFAFFPTLAAIPRFWPALIGAALATLLFYLLGGGKRNSNPTRLVLIGAAINACLFAYVQGVVLLHPAVLENYRFWVLGSLSGMSMTAALSVLPYFIGGLALVLAIAPSLNIMVFGENIATALGANTAQIRLLALMGATMLAAAATALAGPIAFIGLAAPHLVRAMIGSDFRWLQPYSLLVGPILLLTADIIARVIIAPGEVMVGVITAAVGGPLLYAVANRKKGFTDASH
ncbi:iron chelate uptake ABC transporter family permease subunit [Yersinia nurmii]|uniref:Iron chelate uptake ABC transporter family permease subunit n=1 Tax=Yersinia nurmii TaxID=685706 RepID=A0AAW7K8T5_9GAMM|nr:iron chelate uptake ABC transporter family permease subunit [Yersinia nurmii]MDN0088254.1 iron chelate uptake ABC transporter family permease subunit [Yersinia nurmii]